MKSGARIKKFKNYISARMDHLPLWAEFTLFLAVILILLTLVLSITIYKREQNRTVTSQTLALRSLLSLKMTNLEGYLDSLASFAILPVYDSTFYQALQSSADLPENTIDNIRSTVRTYFYSRSDLLSYHVDMVEHGIMVGRDYGQERVYVSPSPDNKEHPLDSRHNYAVLPSDHAKALFRYIHSIIRIEDRKVVALTDFEVNLSGISYLSSETAIPEEVISLYNSDGELLYTNADDTLREAIAGATAKENLSMLSIPASGETPYYYDANGTRYLLTTVSSNDHMLYLSSLVPMSVILSQIQATRIFAILIGLLFLIFAVAAAYILIHYLSAPLSELVEIMERFGRGELIKKKLGRSRESTELSRSFYRMTEKINTLVQENYAAELNEKNARLAALEAQINPHFIYNTLQAIGSEALVNDQPGIYDMLTALAANLRYSIKAPNVISLKDELTYVENYILLQKIRMREKLTVEQDIDASTLNISVPKLCIQTMIENSIIHGIGGERMSIKILLSVIRKQDHIVIEVRDNGTGIEENGLNNIRNSFRSQTLTDSNKSIGLTNLYNRLRLLFGNTADIIIDSRTGEDSFTTVILTLPFADEIKEDHV